MDQFLVSEGQVRYVRPWKEQPNLTRATAGMPEWSSGPFYTYTSGYSPDEMREALDDLDEFVESNGPFDGVFGFSQGASLAVSYILEQQARQPYGPAPFGFGVFFSSVAAFSADYDHCGKIVHNLLIERPSDFQAVLTGVDAAIDIKSGEMAFAKALAACHTSVEVLKIKPGISLDFLKSADCNKMPRPMHPLLVADRVSIPTVHVTGKKDFPLMIEQSYLVQGLCNDSMLRVHRHSGGHKVPSLRSEVKAIATSIEWAAEQSKRVRALSQLFRI